MNADTTASTPQVNPTVIQGLHTCALEAEIDNDAWEASKAREANNQATLDRIVRRYDEVEVLVNSRVRRK
jgi:hypothetical protein